MNSFPTVCVGKNCQEVNPGYQTCPKCCEALGDGIDCPQCQGGTLSVDTDWSYEQRRFVPFTMCWRCGYRHREG